MVRRDLEGATVDQLTERLKATGSGGVANKINCGEFSSAFLLQCVVAHDVELALKRN